MLLARKLTAWDKTVLWTNYRLIEAQRNPRTVSEESIIYDSTGAGLSTKSTIEYDGDLTQTDTPLNVKRSTSYAFAVVSGGTSIMPNSAPAASPTQGVTLTATRISETDFLYTSTDPNLASLKTACGNQNMRFLPITSRVNSPNGIIQSQSKINYDDVNYSTFGRCNATSASVWDSTKGLVTDTNAYLTTRAKFDIYGNVIEATDAKGNISFTEYSVAYSFAYPTKVTSPIPDTSGVNGSNTAFTTTAVYDFTTGLPTSTTDANGQTSTMEYNDPLLRPTKTTAPNGQQTITEYGAGTSESTRWVKSRSQIDASTWKEGYSWFDGLGRTIKSQSVDNAGDVFVETQFDSIGRPSKTSNPYRASETPVWTTNTYDAAGRLWKVTTPDNAVVETTYSVAATGSQIGSVVTVKDQALKERRSVTNALGQLIRVDEPTNTGGLGAIDTPTQPTYYVYDTVNNLTTVNQGVQTRSFTYNSLSRLTSATNPESGTTNYLYDLNGNLTRKTDARGIQTNYVYDALNRVTQRNYTDGVTPLVSYTYDNLPNAKGRLTKVNSSVSTTEYTAFDILGRVTGHKQTTDGTAYTTGYTYKLNGALDEETYPSGRVVKNVLNNNGDLSIVESKKNAAAGYFNYAKNFTYTSAGAVTSMQLGNGKWESTQFNSRLQPTQIALGTVQNGSDKLKLNYDYGSTANNGNVQSQTITVPTVGTYTGFTAIQNYAYDSLNRLQSAVETIGGSQSWKQTFTFDRYGNRNFDMANTTMPAPGCAVAVCNPTAISTNNRLTGYTYDNAGNTSADAGGQTFTYDAENKQTQVNSGASVLGQYSYDGDGKRVKKYVPASGETTIFLNDAAGKQIAEYSTIVYTGTDAKVAYTTNDHLGSPRINTDANGAVTARHDYLPFGEEVTPATTSQRTFVLGYAADTVRKQFTGYERDVESNLDYAQARYLGSTLGRYSSPDPLLLSATLEDPQGWNRYSYVKNRPTTLIDKEGLFPAPAYACTNDNKNCLNDQQRSILENSKIGKLSGQKLYDSLSTAQQNAFTNITDKLASLTTKSGATYLSFVNNVTRLDPDRIIANVSSDLKASLEESKQFTTVPAGDHKPYNDVSYKDTKPTFGNVQFSLNKEGTGADIDMDIGNMVSGDLAGPTVHIFEVVYNKTIGRIFNTKTDQDVIRGILLRDPSIQTITPSPDPRYNRRQK